MGRTAQASDPFLVLPGKAACLAVAAAATVFYVHGASLGHAQRYVTHAQNSIADLIAGPQFGDAAFSLERYHQLAGTYDGAGFEGRRVTVLWATDRTYCVEGVSQSGAVEYLLGPQGHVASGRCPYNAF
jgi:hypothetical protein